MVTVIFVINIVVFLILANRPEFWFDDYARWYKRPWFTLWVVVTCLSPVMLAIYKIMTW